MDKNREIEDLLVLLRDFIVDYKHFSCMCLTVREMRDWFGVLNTGEVLKLIDFINIKRPEGLSRLDLWFKGGLKQPRIDWINEQIKTLQNGK